MVKKNHGSLNAEVVGITFHEITSLLKNNIVVIPKIIETERNSTMPHNGYRQFDNSEIYRAFPDIKIKNFQNGIKKLVD